MRSVKIINYIDMKIPKYHIGARMRKKCRLSYAKSSSVSLFRLIFRQVRAGAFIYNIDNAAGHYDQDWRGFRA